MVHLIDPPPTVTPPKPLPVAPKPQPTNTPPVAPSVLSTPPTPTPQTAPQVAAPVAQPAPIISAPTAPVAVTAPIFNAAYLRNPPPVYPAQSKRRNEAGKVFLRVYVSADGAAEKIELQTSSGWPRLDQAAQDTVRNWRFVPAKQGDKAVPAWVIVPINFVLEG
jgi:protein TonB